MLDDFSLGRNHGYLKIYILFTKLNHDCTHERIVMPEKILILREISALT